MFLYHSLLCLAALFTTMASALPATTPLSVLHPPAHTPVSHQLEDEQRASFCRYNPAYCQRSFPGLCSAAKGSVPSWCHFDINSGEPPVPEEDDITPDTHTLVARQLEEEQRVVYCRYNPIKCQRDYPEMCKDLDKPSPPWCDVNGNPGETDDWLADSHALDTSSPETSLVPRQTDHPDLARECHFNPVSCQKHHSKYCAQKAAPTWCTFTEPQAAVSTHAKRTDPPKSSATSKTKATDSSKPSKADRQRQHELFCQYNPKSNICRKSSGSRPPSGELSDTVDLVERSAQDDPEKQDPENEEPHPINRSRCKHHPHHPYCDSQYCRDHPGSCKSEPGLIEDDDGKLIPEHVDEIRNATTEQRDAWCNSLSRTSQMIPHRCSYNCYKHPEDPTCDIPAVEPQAKDQDKEEHQALAETMAQAEKRNEKIDWVTNATAKQRYYYCWLYSGGPSCCRTSCYYNPLEPTCAIPGPIPLPGEKPPVTQPIRKRQEWFCLWKFC